jgi:chromosome segregation ATPase
MMTEWRQERPPLTDEHLAEIRERTKQGSILTWPEIDRAVLLSEVDRLRDDVRLLTEEVDRTRDREVDQVLRAEKAEAEVDRLRAQVEVFEGRIDEAESRFESILDRLREPLND